MLVSGGGDRPPAFDLNYLWGYQMVKPLSKIAQAEEPDETSMKFYLVGGASAVSGNAWSAD